MLAVRSADAIEARSPGLAERPGRIHFMLERQFLSILTSEVVYSSPPGCGPRNKNFAYMAHNWDESCGIIGNS